MRSEENQKKINTKNIVIVGVIALIIIIAILLATKNPTTKVENQEDTMSKLVTEYYEANIKGKVIGVNQQKVTIAALEAAGYDISKIKDVEKYDKTSAYSLVIIENPSEVDASKIVYKVENHLDGK